MEGEGLGSWRLGGGSFKIPLSEFGPSSPSLSGGFAKGWFPKGWFWRMFPRNEKPERGYVRQNHPFTKPPFYLPVTLFGVDKRVVSKRVVSTDVPQERKPERGYVRQNHPFTKPPFYLPVTLWSLGHFGVGTRFARIDSRESFAIQTPIFITHQADSRESFEFPIRGESPDSRESCESIRANHATMFRNLGKGCEYC